MVHARTHDCLGGGGEMGALMRSIDWSKTSIGAVETWSPARIASFAGRRAIFRRFLVRSRRGPRINGAGRISAEWARGPIIIMDLTSRNT
jgi:hypothetical protein